MIRPKVQKGGFMLAVSHDVLSGILKSPEC